MGIPTILWEDVPGRERGPQPLCALYRVETVLPVARRRLSEGNLALRGVLAEVSTQWLEPADIARVDPVGEALRNVNTPEELAEAERLLARS